MPDSEGNEAQNERKPMTHDQHARRIKRTLDTLHKALDAHHAALAAYAEEHGPGQGVEEGLVALAAAPKKRPPSR